MGQKCAYERAAHSDATRASSRMTEFSRLLSYLRPYRIIFAISIVLMIATGLLEAGTLLLLGPIFDKLSPGKTGPMPVGLLPFAMPSDLQVIAFLLIVF